MSTAGSTAYREHEQFAHSATPTRDIEEPVQAFWKDVELRRRTTSARDVEEAERAYASAGIEVRIERLHDREAFSVELQRFRFGATELLCTTWSTDSWSTVKLPARMALVMNPTSATPTVYTTSGGRVAASATMAPILPPSRQIGVFRPAQSPLFVLCADMKDLERHLQRTAGTRSGSPDFEPALNRRSPEGRRLQRLLNFVVGELLAEPSAVSHPVVRRQLDLLVLDGLLSLPGRHHGLIHRPSNGAASAVVRRAEEFMEANLQRPISMSDVAATCGCSRTKLFQSFKQEREWTPLQFLVRRRMERARRRLLAPREDTTVTSVSLECGYASMSRFAHEYRKLFGELPSTTLNGGV